MAAALAAVAADGGLELVSGQRVLVQWRAQEPWQARVLLAPVTMREYAEYAGEEAPDGAEEKGLIWYAITPDGDIYPHCLLPPALNPQVYGRQWELTARTTWTRWSS